MTGDPSLILDLTRVFDAPRDLVFRVWTEPAHIANWWGPRGYATVDSAMKLRPGGEWHVRTRAPDGEELLVRGIFRKVIVPEHLAFTHAWIEGDGKPGIETIITVDFAEEDGKTRMRFRQAVFDTVENRDSHAEGWGESFDMLAEYLAAPEMPLE